MKKILFSISAVAAVIAMTATFSACSSDDEQSSTATLTVNASRGNYGDGTRAVSIDSQTGGPVTNWKKSDKVVVYKAGWTEQIGNLSPMADSNNNITKLDGSIKSTGLNVGDRMEFVMPRATWDYTGQDGTIETISSTYDYGIANVQITFFDASNKVYGSDAKFETQQAIIKYTLVDASNNPIKATSLTIVSEGGKIVKSRSLDGKTVDYGGLEITPKGNTNVYYVALRNDLGEKDKYTITAKVVNGSTTTIYTSTSSEHKYELGDFIRHTIKMGVFDDTHTERDTYSDKGEVTW